MALKSDHEVSVTQSAAGRVFCAFLPREMTEKNISQELHTLSIDIDQFQRTIESVKVNRYSVVSSTILPGINAIAAPIFDRSSKLVAALQIVGFESSLDISENSKAIQLLQEKSRMISELLGWNGDVLK